MYKEKYFQFNEPVEHVHKCDCAEYSDQTVMCIPLRNYTKDGLSRYTLNTSRCSFFFTMDRMYFVPSRLK